MSGFSLDEIDNMPAKGAGGGLTLDQLETAPVRVIDPATGGLASKTIVVNGRRGGPFANINDLAHALASQSKPGESIDPLKFAAERSKDISANQNLNEQIRQMLFPTATGMLAARDAGLPVGNFGNYASALGRDFLSLPGRGFRAGVDFALSPFGEEHHSEIGPDGREVAVPNEPGSKLLSVSQGFADPTGIFGDPMLAPMMATPMLAPEVIGTRIASLGLPRLGKMIQAYPKAAGFLTYPAQGIGQEVAASALSHGLERGIQPGNSSDATNVAHAAIIPSEAVTPVQLGLGAAGGFAGALGNWLSHASLEAVPGAAQLADMAQKTRRIGYAPTRAEKMGQINDLLDRSGAITESGLARYGQSQTELGADLANPVVEALGPKTREYQQRMRLAQHQGQYGDVSAYNPETDWFHAIGVPPRQEELINSLGGLGSHAPESGIGPSIPAYSADEFRRDLLGRVALANKNDNKAFRGLDEDALRKKVDDAVSTTFSKSIEPGGVAMPEVPSLLGNLNKLAFDRWISTGKQSAKEIGKLGHSILAKKYWENTAMDAFQAGDMQLARRAFGEAKAVDELMNEAATGGMKRRGENAVGRLGSLLSLDYAVPLTGRKIGQEITRKAMLGERFLSGEGR